MIHTTFVRKPACLEDVVKETQRLHALFGPGSDPAYIAAERHLTRREWVDFTTHFLDDQDWIQDFSAQNHPPIGNACPCIRVTADGSPIALLIDPQGSGYARYVALDNPA